MSVAPAASVAGAADFDFLLGWWRVRHRKLAARLANCTQWVEFDGEMEARSILGGFGNIDENVIRDPEGVYCACTLRLFDPAASRWSIHWIDGRDPEPDAPVIGGFEGCRGIFEGEDRHHGRQVRVRFDWLMLDKDNARWEQAFSSDGGSTWESNWVMEFERR